MPFTSKGIYYPSGGYPPQIVEDMTTQGQSIQKLEEDTGFVFINGPETLTAPTTYTAPVGNGNGDGCQISTALSPNAGESLLFVHYMAQLRRSVTAATTNVALFLTNVTGGGGAVQLKTSVNNAAPAVQELQDSTTYASAAFYGLVFTDKLGIGGLAGATADSQWTYNLGVMLPPPTVIWGLPASTWRVEVKYKSSTGNLILGKRLLFVHTMKAG